MSNHPDAIESNIDAHPVKLALAVGVGAVALVVLIVMLALFAVGTYGNAVSASERAALKPDAVAKRIAPVGQVHLEEGKPSAPTATVPVQVAAAPVPAVTIPAPAGAKADGKATYDSSCAACHGAGIAGAPKVGDKSAWAERIRQGNAKLYEHAIKGFQGKAGVMVAKGGNASLSDESVQAAVDYMIAQSK
jgi:cytochrome c5